MRVIVFSPRLSHTPDDVEIVMVINWKRVLMQYKYLFYMWNIIKVIKIIMKLTEQIFLMLIFISNQHLLYFLSPYNVIKAHLILCQRS